MKVGIITMHCPLNYGAVLQTYALQTYIESLGHEVEIIDYRPEYIVYDQSLTYVPDEYSSNKIKSALYVVLKGFHKHRRLRLFKSFLRKRLHLGKTKYKTYRDLQKNIPQYDRYICGSDQIWSIANGAYNDPSYFLGFVKDSKKCFSYAASGRIPDPLPEGMVIKSLPYIKRLAGISVREESIADTLHNYVPQKIEHVVDPIFLYGKKEWQDTIGRDKKLNKQYILVYAVGDSDIVSQTAQRLSKLHDLPIYLISASQKIQKWADKKIMPSVENFVSLIVSAEYVVTNSFHGTSFSILFRKKFFTCTTSVANERLRSIIGLLQIPEAYITDKDQELKEWTYNQLGINNLNTMIEASKHYINDKILS